LREIVELRAIAQKSGKETDYTRGIFQAIGYKEFDTYLQHYEELKRQGQLQTAVDPSSLRPHPGDAIGVRLFDQAIEDMKVATRQFAKSQVRWVRNKLLPEVRLQQQRNSQVYFYSVDSSGESEIYDGRRR
jgi:tRNA A37 N6-isopentenylltransferase MiaA